MRTGQSVSGFIASDPQLTHGPEGVARFYARIGIEHYRHEDDGTFTQLEPSFHNLVMFRASAERAADMFAKGDRFVAAGYVREYAYERDGQHASGDEFVATTIGHDTARSRYTVDRTPRNDPAGQDPAGPARDQGFTPAERTTGSTTVAEAIGN